MVVQGRYNDRLLHLEVFSPQLVRELLLQKRVQLSLALEHGLGFCLTREKPGVRNLVHQLLSRHVHIRKFARVADALHPRREVRHVMLVSVVGFARKGAVVVLPQRASVVAHRAHEVARVLRLHKIW